MSGHSHAANVARTKGKADAIRGKIFTKIGREIAVAVKDGGADPSSNNKLFDVIAKARANNMPNDTIQRSIKKASGELGSVNYFEITYEGYGAGGVAFIVQCLTDNKNRTAGEVRHAFDKFGGSLGTSGSVTFMFDRKGVIVLERTPNLSEDTLMEIALECDAEDFITETEAFVVYCDPGNFHAVLKAFEEKLKANQIDANIVSSGIEFVPQNTIEMDESTRARVEKLQDFLEDLDDVQSVFNNGD